MLKEQILIVCVCLCLCSGQMAYLSKCVNRAKCQEKITLIKTIHEQEGEKTELIKIQKVIEKESGKILPLINPIILKVYSDQLNLVYPLKLVKVVNNKAYEVFYHKDNMNNYQGCDKNKLNQLCGWGMKGFCCNCDTSKYNNPYHIRGGQDCDKTSSSVHCLQYDPLWYSLNELREPIFHHVVLLTMIDTASNKVTNIKLGMSQPSSVVKGISAVYSINFMANDLLDYKHKMLLIPQTSKKSQMMLLSKSLISKDGKECDKIGVSVEAFNSQPNRCQNHAQSCLHNQPMQFWLRDMERTMKNKARKYFLDDQHKGEVKVIKTENYQWSVVVPVADVEISISIEIQADGLFPRQSKEMIRECVYTDNSCSEALYILVFNQWYLHEHVSISLHNCDVNIDGDLKKTVDISPYNTKQIELLFHTDITKGSFKCILSLSSKNIEDKWEITLQKQHNCICYFHKSCHCGDGGYYRPRNMVLHGKFTGPADPQLIAVMVLLFLLILGLTKALLSLWAPVTVGEFGLCLFTRYKILPVYQEKLLTKYEVVYNKRGIPVHPITKKPVQILPMSELFLLNMCFGYYLLFIGLHWLILKICGLDMTYQHPREHVEKTSSKKLITPSTSPVKVPNRGVSPRRMISPRRLISPWRDVDSNRGGVSPRRGVGKQNDVVSDEQTELTIDMNRTSYGIADTPNRRQKNELEECTLRKSFVTENGDDSLENLDISRTGSVKERNLSRKLTIQDLLQLNHVFFNYQGESPRLKNSGECYSLCGLLYRDGRRYKFELGPYRIQMYENIDGIAQKLAVPLKIVHPAPFIAEMNGTEVYQFITEAPIYPCLNISFE